MEATNSSNLQAKMDPKWTETIENTVTMVDVLKDEQDLEDDAAAVLGGSDDKHCTYEKGYVKRQALYSCLTCIPDCKEDPKKAIGVCLACSLRCHETHELVELYTKRQFRCDCGLKGSAKCNLDEKTEENKENSYNQNFSGEYCTCHRPYPDPSDSTPDEMIQCIICEDWYHGRHLNSKLPDMESFSEMICQLCMEKHPFLTNYTGLSHLKPSIADDSISGNESLNVTSLEDSVTEAPKENSEAIGNAEDLPPAKRIRLEDVDEENNKCKKPTINIDYSGGATFWPEKWRLHLCTCSDCLRLYKEHKVEFLPDSEDTVHSYEEMGKSNTHKSAFVRGMEALSNLDRTKQIDAISEYNNMMDKLKEFLHSFVVNRQIVTEEDINRFFRTMKNERGNSVGQQNFCR